VNSTAGIFPNPWYKRFFARLAGIFRAPKPTGPRLVDLRGKVVLMDNDELLLVWERRLRNIRLQKEEEAWNKFEAQYGAGNPQVTQAFVNWQEGLYRYIEREKERFLRVRPGSLPALDKLVQQGARTIVVTKGAKPYTQKCFHLTGLSSSITDIYSPPPGSRQKQFADAVRDHGINSLQQCLKDAIVVGHDLDLDMAWEFVPPKGPGNDGHAPVFLLLDTLAFEKDVIAPLDAMTEVIELLVTRGRNNIWRGFNALRKAPYATTPNYQFKVGLYNHPRLQSKARIPVVYDVRRIGVGF
jgi:FMN phosphatase YigB (HAD superfamily)